MKPLDTPIAIRSRIPLSPTLENRIRGTLRRRVGHADPMITRGTVRFEDINGPRGGVDTVCRIKLVVRGKPSVQAEDRAPDAPRAFDRASHKVRRALDSKRGKHRLSSGGRSAGRRRRTRGKPRRIEKIKTSRLSPARRAAKSRARSHRR